MTIFYFLLSQVFRKRKDDFECVQEQCADLQHRGMLVSNPLQILNNSQCHKVFSSEAHSGSGKLSRRSSVEE